MMKQISKIFLSMFLILSSIIPASFITALAAENDYIVVDDTEIDGTQNHYFTYSASKDPDGATGWSDAGATRVPDSDISEAKTQHWVWNSNYEEAKKHTYTFTFLGTGVELIGVKNDAQNTFQFDAEVPETLAITGDSNRSTTLYAKRDLAYGKHAVTVTLPSPGTGLQISYAKVFGAPVQNIVKETITPEMQNGEFNSFHYTAYEGKEWKAFESEAYIDLGSSDDRASECYYEIPFVGNKIAISAVKAPAHGQVKFSIDGGQETLVDLYAGTRATAIVFTATGLSEGPHVLKAVTQPTKSGSKIVNQVVKAEVYHEPYVLKDITVETSYTLIQGATQNIEVQAHPAYAPLENLAFKTLDPSVATVSETGVITAVKEGTTTIEVSTDGLATKTIEVHVVTQVKKIGGSIVDENLQYTQDTYEDVKAMGLVEKTLTAWQSDNAISEIAIIAKESSLEHVNLEISDFKNDFHSISAENVTATFVKSVDAYTGMPGWGYNPSRYPIGNRGESSDVLYTTNPVDLSFNQVQPIWVDVAIPKDTPAGTYTGTIKVRADGIADAESLTFTYHINVQNVVLPDASEYKDGFDIELWQYPYSSAEYYGVTPFSQEHFKILTSIMETYKNIGGHAITTTINEDAWDRQTYSANEIHYPSMVKWTKNADGTFAYDFTDFDKWIQFNKDLGMGDKIVIYSIAPWHNSFTYWDNGTLVKEKFNTNSQRYIDVWTDFFTEMVNHLDEKGWFDDAYVGIDERGLSLKAINLIESIPNKDGKKLKSAGAMDGITSSEEHRNLARRITDLNVGDTVVQDHPEDFAQLLADRNALGLRTTLYSCTGHIPGNFSLSAPAENYWSILYAYKNGTSGFLRWAYDAWVEDPLRDTTHSSFEAGDCFLVFPDEKDATNPTAKSSIRLEKMAQGVRDANKLMMMANEFPELQEDIDTLLNTLKTRYASSGYYLTKEGKLAIANDMTTLRQGLDTITNKYLDLKGTNVNRSEIQTLLLNTKALLDQATMYTSTSFESFKSAYENAVKVEANVASSQAELDTATAKLREAETGLVRAFTIDIKINQELFGIVSGAGVYGENSEITVVATPNTGYHFVNWTVDGTQLSDQARYTLVIKNNMNLIANFEKDKTPVDPEKPLEDMVIESANKDAKVAGRLPENVIFKATQLMDHAKDELVKLILANNTEYMKDKMVEKIMDLQLMLNNAIYLPNGEVKVSLKLSEDLLKKQLRIVYVKEDGTIEELASTIENGYISFTTTHFSYYAIVSMNEKPTPDPDKPSPDPDKPSPDKPSPDPDTPTPDKPSTDKPANQNPMTNPIKPTGTSSATGMEWIMLGGSILVGMRLRKKEEKFEL